MDRHDTYRIPQIRHLTMNWQWQSHIMRGNAVSQEEDNWRLERLGCPPLFFEPTRRFCVFNLDRTFAKMTLSSL